MPPEKQMNTMKFRLIDIPIPGARWRTIEVSVVVLVFMLFIFYFSLCAFRVPWKGDFHVYISAISALYENFSQLGHENMPVDIKYSLAYTPFMVAIAAFGRVFSLSEYAALQWAGVFNILLYAASILTYFRATSLNQRSVLPAIFFLIISLFLRSTTYSWSSETSFDTMRYLQAYPSLFAWSLALLAFATVEQLFEKKQFRYAVLVAPLLWTLILVHLITASWVIGIIGVRFLFEIIANHHGRKDDLTPLFAGLASSILLAVILVFFWPYSDLVELSKHATVSENPPFGLGWAAITTFAGLYILALPSFYVLGAEKRGKLLILSFLATATALILFKVVGLQFGYRYVFFMAFFAQVAVSEASAIGIHTMIRMIRDLKNKTRQSSFSSVAVSLIAICTLLAVLQAPLMKQSWFELNGTKRLSIPELWARPNSAEVFYAKFPELRNMLSKGDIVLISPNDFLSYQIAVLTGARSVVVNLSPIVPDYKARKKAVSNFLTANTPWASRLLILEKYGVTNVLLSRRSKTLFLSDELEDQMGPPIIKSRNLILFRALPVDLRESLDS